MELIADRAAWNRAVIALGSPSFFMSWEWGDLQEQMGRRPFRIVVRGVPMQFFEYHLPFGKSYLYAPGSPAVVPHAGFDFHKLAQELRSLPTARAPIFAKFEPWNDRVTLRGKGIWRGTALQPKEVRSIDILKTEKALLDDMEHDAAYAIRTAEKRGVTIDIAATREEKAVAFDAFWDVYSTLHIRKKLAFHPKRYYELVSSLNDGCKSKLFIARVEGVPVNVALALYFGGTANYLYAASREGYGKYNAPSLLLWRLMQDAMREGCGMLNLGGISHTKPGQSGLTAFKKQFGGREIAYPGAWDLPLNMPWYLLYRLSKLFGK